MKTREPLQGQCLQLRDLFTGHQRDRCHLRRSPDQARQRAQQQWCGALMALEKLLKLTLAPTSRSGNGSRWQGICLAGPTPLLRDTFLTQRIYQGLVTPHAWQNFVPLPRLQSTQGSGDSPQSLREFPLFPQDPLAQEQFCWLLTPQWQVLLLLSWDDQGMAQFYWSFDPAIAQGAWRSLHRRFQAVLSPDLADLETLVARFTPPPPDYQLVSQFSQLLLDALPVAETPLPPPPEDPDGAPDIELLQALTHEIRTPLTSIRTLTRLLLRRKDLSEDVLKRIEAIDRECQDQISRMDLIFRATELESTPLPELVVPLTLTPLDQVFHQAIPRWQAQAKRYQVDLQVEIPGHLPQVWSNPTLLDQVLSGLIEKFVRSLTQGGAIELQIMTAGDQLKVQFHTHAPYQSNPLKALGDLLMFQPETGWLSLNWDVTKNLFQLLGGKFIRRRRSPLEEILTLYLPLGHSPLED